MNKIVAINKEGNFCILTRLYEGSLSQYTSLEYQHGYAVVVMDGDPYAYAVDINDGNNYLVPADVVKEQLEILSDL